MDSVKQSTARVAHVESKTRVVINRGSDHDVLEGQQYLIYALGPEIIDPETKKPLGRLEIVKGRGTVIHVMKEMATLETESQTVTVRRRVIPSPLMGLSQIFAEKEIVEETVPGEEFYDVGVGDLARRVG